MPLQNGARESFGANTDIVANSSPGKAVYRITDLFTLG